VNANFKAVTDAINANSAALSPTVATEVGPGPTPPAGPRLMITSAEPDLSSLTNPTLLITGENFSSTAPFTGSVFLYHPTQGQLSLSVLGFDLAKQQILVDLPFGIENTPGTHRLKVVGSTGTQFDEGAVAIGTIGPKGDQGDTGPTGATGEKGDQGAQGLMGLQGLPGVAGPKGTTGTTGPKGATGASGAAGPKGDIGFTGPVGPRGPSGTSSWVDGPGKVTTDRKVGVGTTSPGASLEVQSSHPDYTSIRLRNTQTADGIYELRSIQTGGPNNGFGIWGGQEGDLDYRFVITKNGKVGIGFLDPQTKL